MSNQSKQTTIYDLDSFVSALNEGRLCLTVSWTLTAGCKVAVPAFVIILQADARNPARMLKLDANGGPTASCPVFSGSTRGAAASVVWPGVLWSLHIKLSSFTLSPHSHHQFIQLNPIPYITLFNTNNSQDVRFRYAPRPYRWLQCTC